MAALVGLGTWDQANQMPLSCIDRAVTAVYLSSARSEEAPRLYFWRGFEQWRGDRKIDFLHFSISILNNDLRRHSSTPYTFEVFTH